MDETLTFTQEKNGGFNRLAASPRRDGKTTSKISDWIVSDAVSQWPQNFQNAFSPNQSRLAYVSNHTGLDAVYVESTVEYGGHANVGRIASMARHPVWLNENTLIYESTRPGRKGLFRIAIAADGSTPGAPELLFSRGGEAAVSHDGKMICLAVMDEKTGASQLYLLSADGSGARLLAQTDGARRPVFSPDGKAIFFDAPAPTAQTAPGVLPIAPEPQRVLWTLPLVASAPVAQLFSTREAKNGDVEIIGTLFSEENGNVQARLEFSPGEEEGVESGLEGDERAWFSCPLNRAPIHNGVLGAWPLPRKSDGQTQAWTLRLTATDEAGVRAVSTLTFIWPPEKNAQAGNNNITLPPFFGPRPEDIARTPEPEIVIAPTVVKPRIVAPTVAPTVAPIVKPAAAGTMSTLPAPVLPPAPQIQAFDPDEISPFPLPLESTPAPPLARRATIKDAPKIVRASPQKTRATPSNTRQPNNSQPNNRQEAPKNDGGIPSQMKGGVSVPVTVVLRNTGSRSWSSTGPSPVRLIYRWVNADNDIRYRWAVHWLREEVQPGKSTRLKFDLVAPSAPGRFILTYALVRLNASNYDGKKYKPPSSKAKDHRWPGEFGAVSFRITVVS